MQAHAFRASIFRVLYFYSRDNANKNFSDIFLCKYIKFGWLRLDLIVYIC
jgi:hypothetical protein